jgi:hypothetical protein
LGQHPAQDVVIRINAEDDGRMSSLDVRHPNREVWAFYNDRPLWMMPKMNEPFMSALSVSAAELSQPGLTSIDIRDRQNARLYKLEIRNRSGLSSCLVCARLHVLTSIWHREGHRSAHEVCTIRQI